MLPVVVSTLFSLTILHVQQASMRAEQAMSRQQGRLLAGELDADEASASGTGGSDRLKALGLFFAMFCVMAFKTRIHYQYSTTVPLAGVRFHGLLPQTRLTLREERSPLPTRAEL